MRKLLLPLIALIAVIAVAAPTASAAPVTQSASGQGTLFLQTPTGSGNRTFSFNAETRGDGTTVGHAELVNRFNGTVTHIAVDCLRVIGNVASISGQVTQTNSPPFETYSEVVFSVQDNGEGAGAPPDLLSFAFFDLPQPGFDCHDQLFPPTMPILNGNVQVRG
jgi:hypothetical protein